MARQLYYEDVYLHRLCPEAPLLINDFKVLAHLIAGYCVQMQSVPGFSDNIGDYIKAAWAYKLNRGPHYLKMPQQGWRSLVVEDSKPYWRHIECEALGLAEYKAGRSAHTDDFKRLCRAGEEYCTLAGIPFFREPGYEADDWAGAAHRLKLESPEGSHLRNRSLFFVTVDGDWMQLVNSQHNMLWANTGPWTPRLRGDREVVQHTEKKMGIRIARPADMARAKERVGDLGDNLLKGSPLHLYDLCSKQENPLYQIENARQHAQLALELEKPESNHRQQHIKTALEYFNSRGYDVPN